MGNWDAHYYIYIYGHDLIGIASNLLVNASNLCTILMKEDVKDSLPTLALTTRSLHGSRACKRPFRILS